MNGSGHAQDTATFVHYAGALPGTALGQVWDGPSGWDMRSTRSWFAQTLWLALDSHWSIDRVP